MRKMIFVKMFSSTRKKKIIEFWCHYFALQIVWCNSVWFFPSLRSVYYALLVCPVLSTKYEKYHASQSIWEMRISIFFMCTYMTSDVILSQRLACKLLVCFFTIEGTIILGLLKIFHENKEILGVKFANFHTECSTLFTWSN